MSGPVDEQKKPTDSDSNLSYWLERWQTNRITFHRREVSELFQWNLIPKLSSATDQQCVLFSLCGKTVDMMAVLDAGHRVIGIDGSSIGIEAFFKENNISYEIERDESNQCQIYKGIDCAVTLYATDFFTFNKPLQPIDYIWDRGGLVAINPSKRKDYRDGLLRLMAPGRTQLFLVAVNYDDPNYTAPPHVVTDEDAKTLFGSECSVQMIAIRDDTELFNSLARQRINHIEEHLHLIVRKQK